MKSIEDHASRFIGEIIGGNTCQDCEFFYVSGTMEDTCDLNNWEETAISCPAFQTMITEMIAESPVWVRAIKRERG